MTKEIKYDEGYAYIAMSDRLAVFPHNRTTAMVWDMEDDRSLGLLEGHTSSIGRASLNSVEKTAVTVSDENENGICAVKIFSLETMQCAANLAATSLLRGC